MSGVCATWRVPWAAVHGCGGSAAAICPHLWWGQDRPQQLGMHSELSGRSQGKKKKKCEVKTNMGSCPEVAVERSVEQPKMESWEIYIYFYFCWGRDIKRIPGWEGQGSFLWNKPVSDLFCVDICFFTWQFCHRLPGTNPVRQLDRSDFQLWNLADPSCLLPIQSVLYAARFLPWNLGCSYLLLRTRHLPMK